MGTANFYRLNASRHFVLDDIEDHDDYEIEKENLADALENQGYDKMEMQSFAGRDNRISGTIIAASTSSKTLAGVNIDVTIYAVMRTGYYAGVNLDWEYQVETDRNRWTNEVPDEEWIKNEFEDEELSRGLATIQANYAMDFIHKAIEKLQEELENHFERMSTTYEAFGPASNGEVFYRKEKV